jgi:hypothetical protein
MARSSRDAVAPILRSEKRESSCWDRLEYKSQSPQWSRAHHAGRAREGGNERGHERALAAGGGEGNQGAACICDWSFRPKGIRSTDTAGGGWNGRGAELVLRRGWWVWRGHLAISPKGRAASCSKSPVSPCWSREREASTLTHWAGFS